MVHCDFTCKIFYYLGCTRSSCPLKRDVGFFFSFHFHGKPLNCDYKWTHPLFGGGSEFKNCVLKDFVL